MNWYGGNRSIFNTQIKHHVDLQQAYRVQIVENQYTLLVPYRIKINYQQTDLQ